MSHDRTDRGFGGFLIGKICLTCLSPDMGHPFRGRDHIRAGKNTDYVAIKFTERHGHVLDGQRMQQRAETLEFLIGLVHKYLPVLLGIFYSARRQPAIRAKPASSSDRKIAAGTPNVRSGEAAT